MTSPHALPPSASPPDVHAHRVPNESPAAAETRHAAERAARAERDAAVVAAKRQNPALTLRELAEWAHVSPTTVSAILAHKVSWDGRGPGRPTTLTPEGEAVFVRRLQDLADLGVPITRELVADMGKACWRDEHPGADMAAEHVPHFEHAFVRSIEQRHGVKLAELLRPHDHSEWGMELRNGLALRVRKYLRQLVEEGSLDKSVLRELNEDEITLRASLATAFEPGSLHAHEIGARHALAQPAPGRHRRDNAKRARASDEGGGGGDDDDAVARDDGAASASVASSPRSASASSDPVAPSESAPSSPLVADLPDRLYMVEAGRITKCNDDDLRLALDALEVEHVKTRLREAMAKRARVAGDAGGNVRARVVASESR